MNPILDIFLRWAIPFICAGIATSCVAYFRGVKKKQDDEAAKKEQEYAAIRDGLQSLLREEIIRANDKYMQKGYCPVYARESLEKTYSAYHALKGENIVTDLYNQIKKLPPKPPSDEG